MLLHFAPRHAAIGRVSRYIELYRYRPRAAASGGKIGAGRIDVGERDRRTERQQSLKVGIEAIRRD